MDKKVAILVTGASTGIGYDLALYLGEQGHTVYAGARKPADLERLSGLENVIPVQLDVRKPEDVRAVVEIICQRGTGLYGLVNNAGLGGLGLFSTWTDEELLEIFDVNVFGPHRLTNACLPLLFEAQGRVVNIGSQGGMITNRYYGPYTMTKHALEAYTESLHMELSPYGVQVSIVQPGGIISSIGENSSAGIMARFQRAEPPFAEEAQQVLESFSQPEQEPDPDEPESATNRKPSSPRIVSEAVQHALFSPNPRRHYLVGTKWEGDRVINALMAKLLDENDNPRHNYSRDELVSLLDAHLEKRQ